MKIYLMIPLFSLIVSQQCIAGTNCPFNQGFCSGGTCQCLEGYKTFYDKSLPVEKQIFCNYQQTNHFIPLVLEFFPPIGLGHFYIGRYIHGCIKLILAVTFVCTSFYLYKELRIPSYVKAFCDTIRNRIIPEELHGAGNCFTMPEIAQQLFNITFHPFWMLFIFDLYMFFNNKYYDGNGIPLV